MRICIFYIICNIVRNTVKYRFHVRVVKIEVISASGRFCCDLGIGGNEHSTGKFGSGFFFLSFRPKE